VTTSSTTTTTAAPDRHWALFADWCSATDVASRPATPETVLAFLAELPAGPATIRRRVLAVDAAHRRAGYPRPSASPAFDALVRLPRPARFDPALVATALAIIPIGGWPVGIVGRRDAAVVALICTAGLTRRQIQALRTAPSATQGEQQRRAGTVGEPSLPAVSATEDPGTCPACALTRWQWVATATAAAGWRTVRNHLADLGETTAGDETFHDCTRAASAPDLPDDEDGWVPGHPGRRQDENRPGPLFYAIDRHGTPQIGYPLSTRSITTIVAARLAAAAHTDRRQPAATAPDQTKSFAAWSSEDHSRVVAARQAATDRLASFEADLDEADAYAEAILARLDAELSGE